MTRGTCFICQWPIYIGGLRKESSFTASQVSFHKGSSDRTSIAPSYYWLDRIVSLWPLFCKTTKKQNFTRTDRMLSHNSKATFQDLIVVTLQARQEWQLLDFWRLNDTGVRHCYRAGNSSVQAFSMRGMFDEAEPRLSETQDLKHGSQITAVD